MKLNMKPWIFLLAALFISACNTNTDAEDKTSEPKEKTQSVVDSTMSQEKEKKEEKEEEVEIPELSNEEAMSIAEELIANIDNDMKRLQTEHHEWSLQPWIDEPDSDKEEYNKAHSTTRNVLSSYFTDTELNNQASFYLFAYFCECGGFDSIIHDHINIRFEIESQSENHFQISYIKLGDEAGYSQPGTMLLDFKKEDEQWKLDKETLIPSAERALHLEAQDLRDYIASTRRPEFELELIGETVYEGDDYFVLALDNAVHSIYLKKDGSMLPLSPDALSAQDIIPIN